MTKIPVEMTNVQCTSILVNTQYHTCYINLVEQEILAYKFSNLRLILKQSVTSLMENGIPITAFHGQQE